MNIDLFVGSKVKIVGTNGEKSSGVVMGGYFTRENGPVLIVKDAETSQLLSYTLKHYLVYIL